MVSLPSCVEENDCITDVEENCVESSECIACLDPCVETLDEDEIVEHYIPTQPCITQCQKQCKEQINCVHKHCQPCRSKML